MMQFVLGFCIFYIILFFAAIESGKHVAKSHRLWKLFVICTYVTKHLGVMLLHFNKKPCFKICSFIIYSTKDNNWHLSNSSKSSWFVTLSKAERTEYIIALANSETMEDKPFVLKTHSRMLSANMLTKAGFSVVNRAIKPSEVYEFVVMRSMFASLPYLLSWDYEEKTLAMRIIVIERGIENVQAVQ